MHKGFAAKRAQHADIWLSAMETFKMSFISDSVRTPISYKVCCHYCISPQ